MLQKLTIITTLLLVTSCATVEPPKKRFLTEEQDKKIYEACSKVKCVIMSDEDFQALMAVVNGTRI